MCAMHLLLRAVVRQARVRARSQPRGWVCTVHTHAATCCTRACIKAVTRTTSSALVPDTRLPAACSTALSCGTLNACCSVPAATASSAAAVRRLASSNSLAAPASSAASAAAAAAAAVALLGFLAQPSARAHACRLDAVRLAPAAAAARGPTRNGAATAAPAFPPSASHALPALWAATVDGSFVRIVPRILRLPACASSSAAAPSGCALSFSAATSARRWRDDEACAADKAAAARAMCSRTMGQRCSRAHSDAFSCSSELSMSCAANELRTMSATSATSASAAVLQVCACACACATAHSSRGGCRSGGASGASSGLRHCRHRLAAAEGRYDSS